MPDATAETTLYDRYLAILGASRQPPGLRPLRALIAAHLARIPFENVSKLYYRHDSARRGRPRLALFLDGIERFRFGGTCYTNNYHFHQLLAHLGYHVLLCGADMAAPNVHMVNIVTLGGRRYLVDVGYGAPLAEPLDLDSLDTRVIVWGSYQYAFRPHGPDGRPRLRMYRDGLLTHGYVVNTRGRTIDEFADVIAESFSDQATFMHALLVARFDGERSIMIRNRELARGQGAEWRVSEIGSPGQLPHVIAQEFSMPPAVVGEALAGLQLTRQP